MDTTGNTAETTITVTTEGGPITVDVGDSKVVTLRLELVAKQGSYTQRDLGSSMSGR